MNSTDQIARRLGRIAAVGAASGAAVGAGNLGLVSGALTVDHGVGRRVRPLGPLSVLGPPERRLIDDKFRRVSRRR